MKGWGRLAASLLDYTEERSSVFGISIRPLKHNLWTRTARRRQCLVRSTVCVQEPLRENVFWMTSKWSVKKKKKEKKNVAVVWHAAVNSFSASRITDFKSILNVCLKGQFIRYGQNFILNVQEVNYQLCEKTTVMRLCLKMSMWCAAEMFTAVSMLSS